MSLPSLADLVLVDRELRAGLVASWPWKPNLYDWRHSQVMVDKRRDAGEQVPGCDLLIVGYPDGPCGAELDVDPVPHHPRCPAAAGKPKATRVCQEPGCDQPIASHGGNARYCVEHRRLRRQAGGFPG